MNEKNHRVCPASHAWVLDNPLRRLFQKPCTIVGEFVRPGMRVMDLGCGPGYFTLSMAKMVGPEGKVVAVDLQPEMLRRLERKALRRGLLERVELHACQENRLNLEAERGLFDFALLYYMIHETPDPEGLLTELSRLMKNGGKILVVDPVFHVKEDLFRSMLLRAEEIGYRVEYGGRERGGWCAVLTRDGAGPD